MFASLTDQDHDNLQLYQLSVQICTKERDILYYNLYSRLALLISELTNIGAYLGCLAILYLQ